MYKEIICFIKCATNVRYYFYLFFFIVNEKEKQNHSVPLNSINGNDITLLDFIFIFTLNNI